MLKWYLITINLHAFQVVTFRLTSMDVQFFSPSRQKITRRSDCQGVRISETTLFPGYLFVQIDPEVVHFSTIAEIPGVKEFVKFGRDICVVSGDLIDAWRTHLLLRVNPKVTTIEYRNVPNELILDLERITCLPCKTSRQAELYKLLENGFSRNNNSLIATVMEQPYVSKLID